MIFVDINTFYAEKTGGIRTYHHAKIAWFSAQQEHRYFLFSPGPQFLRRELNSQVTLIEFYGLALTADPLGYRLLLDYLKVAECLREINPHIVEAGDPWLTGLFCLLAKKIFKRSCLWTSFYHSDPIVTYMLPWVQRGKFLSLKKKLIPLCSKVFYALQNQYHATCISSKAMDKRLADENVGTRLYTPFGVDKVFFSTVRQISISIPSSTPFLEKKYLLYVGRLDIEKGIDLLIAILPRLLEIPQVEISVLGRGSRVDFFQNFKHARFHYLGFKPDKYDVAEVYQQHQILLAPGPFETFGLGVLEAMACGLVVVGPNRGGTSELLSELASNFIFHAEDSDAFYQTILKALACDFTNESLRSQALAQKYGTWDKAIERQTQLYKRTYKAMSEKLFEKQMGKN